MHSSVNDLSHEIALLEEADALVLEGQEEKLISSWLRLPLTFFDEILANIYTDKDVLIQQAQEQGIPYRFTRKSNDALLSNASRFQGIVALGLFIICIVGIFVTSSLLWRASWIFLAGLGPILFLREINMLKKDQKNADKRIASYTQELHQDNDHVLVIVGKKHADGVLEALPKDIEVRKEPSKANWMDHIELLIKISFSGGKAFAVALLIQEMILLL